MNGWAESIRKEKEYLVIIKSSMNVTNSYVVSTLCGNCYAICTLHSTTSYYHK